LWLLFIFAFAKAILTSQQKNSVAHYVAQTKFDIKPDTTKSKNPENDAALKARFMEALNREIKKNTHWNFTGKESNYEESSTINLKPSVGDRLIVFWCDNASNTIYKPTRTRVY
jgi:hypothetical protein